MESRCSFTFAGADGAKTAVSNTQYPFPQVFLADSGGKKRTVRANRRRPTGASSGDRRRATAPKRRRPDRPSGGSGGQRPPTPRPSAPRPTGSGGGRPPNLIIIGIVIVLALLGLLVMSFLGGGDGGSTSAPIVQETAPVDDVSSDSAADFADSASDNTFVPPAASGEGQTWLIMLYQDADDKILEQDIFLDLNEAERVGSSDRIHMVAQIDRYAAGFRGDGDWSTTRRYYVTQDDDLSRINSELIADLGEVSMADGASLVDFVTWSVATFPADKHVLIMSDHGMGWPGGWSDKEPGGPGVAGIPLAQALGDQLYLMELDDALGEIRERTGLEQFELVGMDACLMGHVEVFTALAPHARYAVASQEVEPALGWAYTGFLSALSRNPDVTGAELGRYIIDSYIQEDQRIVDDLARAEFAGRGPLGDLFGMLAGSGTPSAEQIARQLEQNITLTAVDLAVMPTLVDSLNNLAFVLQDSDQATVAQARTYAQSYTSVFGRDIPPSYIDIGSFVQLLAQNSDSVALTQATEDVMAALQDTVVAERHGPNKRGSTGISIYFPNSQLYRNPATGPQSYTAVSRRFAEATLWDDFLAFHYTGSTFSFAPTTLAVPERSDIVAPGAGQISVSPLTLSAGAAAPGAPVLLSADISGDNVGYVYLWVGFYDAEANAIFVADSDYLESAASREIDGVTYPVWGGGPFTMEFEWEPLLFAVSDGTSSALAALTPQSYGAAAADAVYTVDGIYTYGDGGERRYARLLFQNGLLRQVFGFNGIEPTGAPREIIPQSGDMFTVLERWLDLDGSGNVMREATQEGETLTFGDQTFTWEALDAAPGDYVVGFIVEDLDGNQVEVYETIVVE